MLYILDGKIPVQVDHIAWSQWLEANYAKKVIARDCVGESIISTVFLAIDHGHSGQVLLFETMVFEGPLDGEQVRYSTWEQAEAGHTAMVDRVRGENHGG